MYARTHMLAHTGLRTHTETILGKSFYHLFLCTHSIKLALHYLELFDESMHIIMLRDPHQ